MRTGKAWYVADVVIRIAVEGDPRSVVHVNTLLVRAASPEGAYEAAVELGRAGEATYDNPQGRRVTMTFRGLRHLDVVHGRLQHGTEILYEQRVGLDEAAVADLVLPRERLALFREPTRAVAAPDYMPEAVARTLREAGFTP